MIPTRSEAERLLEEAEKCNPGPWGNHSRVAAHCAERIAEACEGMDPEKAYILGLLHDIGRKFGVRHLGHVSDGFSYMMSLGYDEVARICLTHSFNNMTTDEYIGRFDTTEEELELIQSELKRIVLGLAWFSSQPLRNLGRELVIPAYKHLCIVRKKKDWLLKTAI